MTRSFPNGFLFGTATSATQVEGGACDSDWTRFARETGPSGRRRCHEGDTPDLACDHWQRWRDDVTLQAELGMTMHRFSLEWARIEPVEGRFDAAVLERYREEAALLKEHGITPMITLHHFSLPGWLADKGGLLCPDLPRLLERYATVVVKALADVCRLWVTINEPNVLSVAAYLFGWFPPGETGRVDKAALAQHRLLESHVRMYRAIHDESGRLGHTPAVGVAHHLRVVEPCRPQRRRDRAAARAMDAVFNDAFAGALASGELLGPLDDVASRLPVLRTGGFSVREAKGTQDFFGLNYYTRDLVRFAPSRPQEGFVVREVPKGAETSALGWEVFPAGLTALLEKWHRRTKLPFFITENGIATKDDAQRSRFLWRHLHAVKDAIDAGVDVRGYLHWSLMDNFEWHEGYAPRFGLVEVDYETQVRRPRESARLYANIIGEHALPDGLLEKHLKTAAASSPIEQTQASMKP